MSHKPIDRCQTAHQQKQPGRDVVTAVPDHHRRSANRRNAIWLAVVVAASLGCGREELEVGYGRRQGDQYSASVNGTRVLAKMFNQSGRSVRTMTRLSPKLNRYDTVVWTPDQFAPPDQSAREFLEQWLADGSQRSLVYVGRDFDAAVAYWKQVVATQPASPNTAYARELARAQVRHDTRRLTMPNNLDADWFVVERDHPHRRIRGLRGPWSEGIDAAKAAIETEGRLTIPPNTAAGGSQPRWKVLLESDQGEVLVAQMTDRAKWGRSEILIVTNGSFLLNYPLVNQEHRKLAGRLIDHTWNVGDVVFIESDESGIRVSEHEPSRAQKTFLDWMGEWPLSFILPHFLVLGVLFCFAYFPIFGRPRALRGATTTDFGHHLHAIGQLYQRTGDGEAMVEAIKDYQQHVRRESGVSHLGEFASEPNQAPNE